MDPVLQQRVYALVMEDHHKTSGSWQVWCWSTFNASISLSGVMVLAKRNKFKHTFINLNDDEWVKQAMILPADDAPIPREWLDNADVIGETGTLVVWSSTDWPAETIYTNSDFLVGRMYRNWLSKKVTLMSPMRVSASMRLMQKKWKKEGSGTLLQMTPSICLKTMQPNPGNQARGSVQNSRHLKELPFEFHNEEGEKVSNRQSRSLNGSSRVKKTLTDQLA